MGSSYANDILETPRLNSKDCGQKGSGFFPRMVVRGREREGKGGLGQVRSFASTYLLFLSR